MYHSINHQLQLYVSLGLAPSIFLQTLHRTCTPATTAEVRQVQIALTDTFQKADIVMLASGILCKCYNLDPSASIEQSLSREGPIGHGFHFGPHLEQWSCVRGKYP